MIVLVLSMHAADTYSTLGNWYYQENTNPGLGSLLLFATYQSVLQAFFMALLFFLAGYFVPGALDRKGPRQFLRDRTVRLGLPTLFYVFVLGPFTEYYVASSWHEHASFVEAWRRYVVHGKFLSGTGPMWFCAALWIFCVAYIGVSKLSFKSTPRTRADIPSHRGVAAFVCLLAAATFLARLVQPAGTSFYNMQLGDFPQYILLFAAGIAAGRGGWLLRLPHRFATFWWRLALSAGSVVWVVLLLFGGALQRDIAPYQGGWHWQSAGIDVWESLVCVGVSLGLIVLFRERFNTRGRIAAYLSGNAFAVYVMHPPILIALARVLHPWRAALVTKFCLLTVLSVLASFAVCGAVFRRLPVLRQIL